MRNLKRVLSLTLASVMLMGMMVVGSNAAAGYDDVSKDDNVEAIEVLQAIEVMVGDERGFGPERPVNRAEMAVVMGKLLNLDYNYYTALCPFTDVYDWAQGWVGACYANKIVSGRGDGIYDPGATVTAVEAASMLMRALGYFQYQNDYAAGFELATVTQGKKIGIFDNVGSSASEPMTRNQVAQMVLNALQSDTVEPDGNTINLTTPDGTVLTGKVNYVSVTRDEAFATAIKRTEATSVGSQNSGWIVELGERLYDGKLELVDDDLDVFGRPARTWKFNGAEIGTYAKRELIVNNGIFYTGVTGREIYELLGQTTIRDNEIDSYLDGAENGVTREQLVRSNNTNVNSTARGVLTEVYLDNDKDLITIVSINTYLAKANSDYSSESETISLTVYDSASGIPKLVDLEDAANIDELKRDDWVLLNWADPSKAHEDKVVVEIFDVEILTDRTVTKFSMNNKEDKDSYLAEGDRINSITTDGTEYKNNVNAWYKAGTLNDYNKDLLVDKTYNIFLDQYGNFIGAELYSGKDQYVFITGYDRPKSSISVSTATANAIFTDGTMQNIQVNVKNTNENIRAANDNFYQQWGVGAGYADGKEHEEMWYSYNLRDGVYTLTPVTRYTYRENTTGADETIEVTDVRLVPTADSRYASGNALYNVVKFGGSFSGYSYGDDDSVYITVEMGDVDRGDLHGIDEVTGFYTGIEDVKLVYGPGNWAHAVYDEEGFVIAAVVLGEAEGIADNYAYILGKTGSERYEGGVHYWEFDAIIGGEEKTMTVEDRFGNTVQKLKKDTIQELVLNSNGNVVTIRDLPNSRDFDATIARNDTYTETEVANGSGDENDKIYTNFDYLAGSGESQDHKDYNAYLIDISGRFVRSNAPVDRYGAGAIGTISTNSITGLRYIDLSIDTRTLHYTRTGNDMGLRFAADAKAFVSRSINGERDVYEYASVANAFSILQDADGDPTNNGTTGKLKQFSGLVAAVLDTKGVAQWVFFYDNTPVNGKDTATGGFQGQGDKVEAGIGVQEVNALFRAGAKAVTINGDWMPADTVTNDQALVVPSGCTLYIDGDFNTVAPVGTGDVITTTTTAGSIVVNGTFSADDSTAKNIQYKLTADDIVLTSSASASTEGFKISGTVTTTSGNLDICGANNYIVNISGTVKVAGNIRALDNAGSTGPKTLNITGHVETASNVDVGTGTIVVSSTTSLIVTGNVTGKLYLNNDTAQGTDSKLNGYVKIGGSVTEFYNYNTSGASVTPEIGTAVTTFVAEAGTKTIITGNWNPTSVTLKAGSTIQFQGDGEATGAAAGLFVNSSSVHVNTKDETFTVPAGTDASKAEDGTVTGAIVVEEDDTPAYTITGMTVDASADPEAPVLKIEVTAAGGVDTTECGAQITVTCGDKTATKAVGTTFDEGKAVVSVDLTGSGDDKLNLALTAGTQITLKAVLKASSDAAADTLDESSTTYTPVEVFTVTVADGDEVVFYTSNESGATPLSKDETNKFAKNTVLYVKLANGETDNYVFNTEKVTAVGSNGVYSLTLTGNVKGAADDNDLIIALVAVTTTDKTTKVGVYKDSACQTAVTNNEKFPVGTTLYVQAKDTNTLKSSVTDSAIEAYAVNNDVGSFKIKAAISDPDTLFAEAASVSP